MSTTRWGFIPAALAMASCAAEVTIPAPRADGATGAASSASSETSSAEGVGGSGVVVGAGGPGGAGTEGAGGAGGVGMEGAGGASATCANSSVAAASDEAVYLAVDADFVYWTGGTFSGTVWRAPKSGGAGSLLSTSPVTYNQSAGLAVDETTVYWSNGDGGVYSAPKAGGPPKVLLPSTDDGAPGKFVIDDLYVYALTPDTTATSQLVKLPKTGGSSTVLATGLLQPIAMAIDSANVYWADGGSQVSGVPKAGGTVVPFSYYSGFVLVLAADDSGVYGLDIECNVLKFSEGGGTTQVLAKTASSMADCEEQLAMDATRLYWAASLFGEASTTLYSVAKTGGDPTAFLTCKSFSGSGVAVDSTNIFWAANDPEDILRLPK